MFINSSADFCYIFSTSVTKFLIILSHAGNLNEELALPKLMNLPLGGYWGVYKTGIFCSKDNKVGMHRTQVRLS